MAATKELCLQARLSQAVPCSAPTPFLASLPDELLLVFKGPVSKSPPLRSLPDLTQVESGTLFTCLFIAAHMEFCDSLAVCQAP